MKNHKLNIESFKENEIKKSQLSKIFGGTAGVIDDTDPPIGPPKIIIGSGSGNTSVDPSGNPIGIIKTYPTDPR